MQGTHGEVEDDDGGCTSVGREERAAPLAVRILRARSATPIAVDECCLSVLLVGVLVLVSGMARCALSLMRRVPPPGLDHPRPKARPARSARQQVGLDDKLTAALTRRLTVNEELRVS